MILIYPFFASALSFIAITVTTTFIIKIFKDSVLGGLTSFQKHYYQLIASEKTLTISADTTPFNRYIIQPI